MNKDTITPTRPIDMDTRVPMMMRLMMSRPSLSGSHQDRPCLVGLTGPKKCALVEKSPSTLYS